MVWKRRACRFGRKGLNELADKGGMADRLDKKGVKVWMIGQRRVGWFG